MERRKIQKRREIVNEALHELNALTVTIHGRIMLVKVCEDPDNGLDPEIRRMYWILLKEAPVQEWARWN